MESWIISTLNTLQAADADDEENIFVSSSTPLQLSLFYHFFGRESSDEITLFAKWIITGDLAKYGNPRPDVGALEIIDSLLFA